MSSIKQIQYAWVALGITFAFLVVAFSLDLFGKTEPVQQLPLVDTEFLKTEPWRESYGDLVSSGGELDFFDCYICHEEGKKLELKFDAENQVVIPDEHSDIVMGHGSHGRNNNCFNCHSDENLLVLHARDGNELKFDESSQLCGSCHGPTKSDWDAGVHGRISGYWDPSLGASKRLDCVNCHDPHSPSFPGRKPAPPPHHLHDQAAELTPTSNEH